MTTALKVLELNKKEVGTVESPPKSNKQKYGKDLGQNGVFWCALYVTWIFMKAGLKIPKINYSYVPDWANWFKKMGRFYDSSITPKPGDVVFFAFTLTGIAKKWTEHIGFVVEVLKDGKILCYEGNTSPENHGSQDNGGGVYLKKRSKLNITGYGRPFYD